MPSTTKAELEREFYNRVPNARKISPVYRAFFNMMYEAHLLAKQGKKLLNIYSSQDFSGNREEVYREKFFSECEYEAIDFWKDHFIYGDKQTEEPHTLPFMDNSLDLIVTTKVIMEHISEPQKVISEMFRVLKPGGHAFIAAPLVRRQHQKPHDYFRYTEFALEYLFKKAGFAEINMTPSNGSMVTLATYVYFFQRSHIPQRLQFIFDWIHYFIIEPVAFFLDRYDNGYGRDLTLYFLVKARKG